MCTKFWCAPLSFFFTKLRFLKQFWDNVILSKDFPVCTGLNKPGPGLNRLLNGWKSWNQTSLGKLSYWHFWIHDIQFCWIIWHQIMMVSIIIWCSQWYVKQYYHLYFTDPAKYASKTQEVKRSLKIAQVQGYKFGLFIIEAPRFSNLVKASFWDFLGLIPLRAKQVER